MIDGSLAGPGSACHPRPVRLTSLELLVIVGVILLAFTPVAVIMSRRQGARLAGVWVPVGMAGVYLWAWALTEHVWWLGFAGATLIVAAYAIQWAVWRSDRRHQDTGPGL